MTYRIGVDIGGTFTDFVLFDDQRGTAVTHKQLTTPTDPAKAVLDGVQAIVGAAGIPVQRLTTVVHGTTLVTNSIIERKGVPTAMVVTSGFSDVLDIRLERRYDLFDLNIRFPEPVVPRHLRIEIGERTRYDGEILAEPSFDGLEAKLRRLRDQCGVQAVAICFLHSYANPVNEVSVRDWILERFPDLHVSISSTVFPYMREYERWVSTCLNAFVQPVVDKYVARLESGLASLGFRGSFLVMSSSGGTLAGPLARAYPLRLLESGPAAGALMSARIGRHLGHANILSFDMGGTTAKGCIVRDGKPIKRYEMEVARVHEFKAGSGLPAKVPVIDMIEIGAGGGSLAWIDDRGALAMGPHSAGAEPGPACYGRGGDRPTLTDANLLLGYLGAESFLGGDMRLDTDKATEAIRRHVADPLNVDVVRAAWGMHEVINEDVARAFRVHAAERGVDYRRCKMVVFGGSGPLHGVRVARKLRIPRVVCPAGAGVMSAFGLLTSPPAFETVLSSRTELGGLSASRLAELLADLEDRSAAALEAGGVRRADIRFERRADVRYVGQGYEVEVKLPDGGPETVLADLPKAFANAYTTVFGMDLPGRDIEIVNWKIEAIGPRPGSETGYRIDRFGRDAGAKRRSRPAWFPESDDFVDCPIFDRYALAEGDVINGPALIEERESTCVLGPLDRLFVDGSMNLIIEVGWPA